MDVNPSESHLPAYGLWTNHGRRHLPASRAALKRRGPWCASRSDIVGEGSIAPTRAAPIAGAQIAPARRYRVPLHAEMMLRKEHFLCKPTSMLERDPKFAWSRMSEG